MDIQQMIAVGWAIAIIAYLTACYVYGKLT